MKPSKFLLGILFLFAAVQLPRADSGKEDLGYDIYDGKTNKIDHIAEVDPRFVWVIYEGGTSGRKIARAELPPQLKVKYPYDPQKAAAFIKEKGAEYQAQLAMEKAGLRVRESDLESQIDALDKQTAEDESEIKNLTRQIRTARKGHEASVAKESKIKLIQDQDDIRQRREKLEDTLKQVQAQIDVLP